MTSCKPNKLIIYLGLFLGHQFSVYAADPEHSFSGTFLLSMCTAAISHFDDKSAKNPLEYGYCVGYINGFRTGHTSTVFDQKRINKSANSKLLFCPSNDVTNIQMARVLVKFLQDRPQTLHLPADFLTMKAFTDAFSCN